MDKSFSLQVKAEVLSSVVQDKSFKSTKAFLSAVIHTAGSIVISDDGLKLELLLEHSDTKDYVCEILKTNYGTINAKENARSIAFVSELSDKLLKDYNILTNNYKLHLGIDKLLITKAHAKIAYMRGVFLACGSVSVKKGYHLEFSVSNKMLGHDIVNILSNFYIKAKMLARNERVVVYIKGVEGVSDTLALLGANRAVLKINSSYVDRQIKQLANRRSNCDLANIDKVVSAYEKQRDAIEKLQQSGQFNKLDIKLQEAGEARLNNPFISLGQLAQLLNLTKSGITHRLNKLIALSENIKNKN